MNKKVTKQGNVFNGPNQLVKLNGDASLPGLDGSQLTNITASGYDYAVIQDQKAQNTDGGSFANGAWRTRDLNTIVVDTGSNVSLSSNQFALTAGTYRINASAPAQSTSQHQIRLQNITDTATTLVGTSENNGGSGATRSFIQGRFVITSSKTFEIQHRCFSTINSTGFGQASNFTTEIYTSVELWKEPL